MSDKQAVAITINGHRYESDCEARLTLADFIRQRAGLTGTHLGCEHGVCGACTVLLDGQSARSCLMLAVQADGSTITTVEGLGDDGSLDPVQEAFIRHDALQCGYCTPGLIVAARTLLDGNPRPTIDEIKEGLSGNLCRCGTYTNVFNAVLAASGQSPLRDAAGGDG